jgi:hypothetical protein
LASFFSAVAAEGVGAVWAGSVAVVSAVRRQSRAFEPSEQEGAVFIQWAVWVEAGGQISGVVSGGVWGRFAGQL